MKSKKITLTFFFIAFCILPALVIGQAVGPTPTEVPIDGGLTYLIISGIAYGVVRLVKKNKQTQ